MLLNKENIIAKVLSGNASEKEHQKLNAWINENPANKLEFEHAQNIWEQAKNLKQDKNHNVTDAWAKFKTLAEQEPISLTKTPNYNKLRVAAAIALFVLFGFIVKFNFSESTQPVPMASTKVMRIAQPESIGVITEIEELDTLFNLSQIQVEPVKKRAYKRKWIKNPNLVKLATGDSARAFLLPDNSIVFLNANSSLEYVSDFSQQNRHVSLIGEGYFQVAQDSGLFSVDCQNTIVRTSTGSFNIKSYKEDKEVEVIVASGVVEFSGIGKKEFKILSLNAGETGLYSKDNDTFVKNNSARKNYKWWQKSFRMKIKNFFDKLLGRSPSKQVINQVK